MKNKDLDILMGMNLKRIRRERKLTQEQLSDQLQIDRCQMSRWESGSKGVGKTMLLRLCNELHVKPYSFFLDSRTPYVASAREREILRAFREAAGAGVDDMVEQFAHFAVSQARKKQRALRGAERLHRNASEPDRGEQHF
jgi:transcriptional regulator with XRE-family HTH domain